MILNHYTQHHQNVIMPVNQAHIDELLCRVSLSDSPWVRVFWTANNHELSGSAVTAIELQFLERCIE